MKVFVSFIIFLKIEKTPTSYQVEYDSTCAWTVIDQGFSERVDMQKRGAVQAI